jgi:ABC-2 type transport system permease protein
MILRLGGEKSLTDAFLAAELGIVGVLASVFGVQAAMRLRAEEAASHAEAVLATSVGRIRWASSHLVITLLGTTTLLIAAGLGAGLAHGARLGELSQAGPVLTGALVQLPAAWVVAAIVVALFGLAPRLIVGGWVALVAFLLLGEFGPLLRLDQWLLDLAPFTHLPKLPGAPFTAAPIWWLLAVAATLIAAGLVGFRRRDVG